MRTRRDGAIRLAAVALAVVSVAALPAVAEATCDSAPLQEPLTFHPPRYIDTARAGGEPVSIVAQDGSILVSAHAGTTHLFKNVDATPGAPDFAVGYTNQTLNWRSTDDGETWTFVGTAGAPAGPHTPTSTGFSDPDLTMDAGGRIYNTEIDLANVAVYASPDDGQSFPVGNPQVTPGDRPWLVGQEPDEVFLLVNAFIDRMLWRSTDGGVTFLLANDSVPLDGKPVNDPLDPAHGLIGPYGSDIAISSDDGKTWQVHPGPDLGPSTQFFGTVGADRSGTVYMAAAGGYTGPNDRTPDGEVTFASFDRATETWSDPVVIPTPPGDALWPWIVAGDDGRVAVAWYQSLAEDPKSFYVYVAETMNGNGTTVSCDDGSTRRLPATFSVANASGRPVHVGGICLQGTNCNLSTSSDRRLGDFLTVNYDRTGRLFVVSGDTRLTNVIGGAKPVANPIFLQQATGAPLIDTPMKTRATRCLFPLPVC